MKFFVIVLHLLFLISIFSVSSICADEIHMPLIGQDGFFRALGFKKIEKICFQLHDDLDIFTLNESLKELLEQSGYLLKQFCCLFTAVQELVGDKEESRMFLPDDIAYLLNLLQNLEHKLKIIEQDNYHENHLLVCMKVLLEQGKQRLEMLVEHNIEVVFDATMLEQYLIQC